jgi:hypothetical protein
VTIPAFVRKQRDKVMIEIDRIGLTDGVEVASYGPAVHHIPSGRSLESTAGP